MLSTSAVFSLIIITSGRVHHLKNTLKAISLSTVWPKEINLVLIDLEIDLSEFSDLPIKKINFRGKPYHTPLAEARNLGAKQTTTDYLFFLDVDCIPHPNYFETLLEHIISKKTGLFMGTPKYLTHQTIKEINIEHLESKSQFHPDRKKHSDLIQEPVYALFWSLCFAIRKRDFEIIGGFDKNFIGYGAEDTDFALMCEKNQLPFYCSPAIVYHQQHKVFSPPINHLKSIAHNAHVFYNKWGFWPMEKWLEEFEKLDLIHWNTKSNSLHILKKPSVEMLQKYERPYAAYA